MTDLLPKNALAVFSVIAKGFCLPVPSHHRHFVRSVFTIRATFYSLNSRERVTPTLGCLALPRQALAELSESREWLLNSTGTLH